MDIQVQAGKKGNEQGEELEKELFSSLFREFSFDFLIF